MTYIVHGASGAQGGPVLAALKAAGKPVLSVVRHEKSLNDTAVVATDLSSVEQLVKIYAGATGVFVHLPLGAPDQQLAYAKNIAAALVAARPARIVVSTSGQIIDRPDSPLQQPADSAIPTLVRALEKAGLSFAVVAPRLYLENLLAPHVFEGVHNEGILRYPLAESFPVAWASNQDVADVVVKLFDRTDVSGVVAIGQQPALTGDQLAAAFGEYLGKKVIYEAITPEQFGEVLRPYLGEAVVGVVGLYNAFRLLSHHSFDSAHSAQTLLNIKPRTTLEWLKQTGV